MKEIAADIRATIWATLASNSCQFLTLKFKKADGLLYLLRLLNLLCLETVVTAAALILNCPHNAWCHTRALGPSGRSTRASEGDAQQKRQQKKNPRGTTGKEAC